MSTLIKNEDSLEHIDSLEYIDNINKFSIICKDNGELTFKQNNIEISYKTKNGAQLFATKKFLEDFIMRTTNEHKLKYIYETLSFRSYAKGILEVSDGYNYIDMKLKTKKLKEIFERMLDMLNEIIEELNK